MKTVLVPTDFSNAAMNAAEYAVSFAKEINANVLLLHAYNVPMALAGDVPVMITTPEELQKDNEKLLKKEVARLKKKATVQIAYKAKMGLAVDEIVEEEKNVDFIVMGMTGAGKLSEFLLGSITTATLKKVKTPVIVVPENPGSKNLNALL
jgi:nucleotide-binding universal stress UspA family protein